MRNILLSLRYLDAFHVLPRAEREARDPRFSHRDVVTDLNFHRSIDEAYEHCTPLPARRVPMLSVRNER